MPGCSRPAAFASRHIATRLYAETSMATAKPARVVSVNEPSRSSRGAYATAWTRTSISPLAAFHFAHDRARSARPTATSQASTNVAPMDSASGRTRRSSRLSTDEKPSVAPCVVERLGDAPGDRVVVRDPEDQRLLAVEQAHPVLRSSCARGRAYHRAVPRSRHPTDLHARPRRRPRVHPRRRRRAHVPERADRRARPRRSSSSGGAASRTAS